MGDMMFWMVARVFRVVARVLLCGSRKFWVAVGFWVV